MNLIESLGLLGLSVALLFFGRGRNGAALPIFQKSPWVVTRRIAPRFFGRTIWRNEQRFYRWCFSDLETARALAEQFRGAFYKTAGS